jgi:phosphate transport system protein
MTLKEHTVKSYDKDLESISGTIDEMMYLSLESIDIISNAIKNHSDELVEMITRHDYKINNLDFLIEKKMTAMLAMRQPMAVDLRYVVSSLKVSSNLERIGDQAKSIVKKLNRIKTPKIEEEIENILIKMLDISKIMVKESVQAFNYQDDNKANEVLSNDDKIDKLYKELFSITNQENFSREEITNIINILFIAKSFERLADHATNIAEITKYVITGETK